MSPGGKITAPAVFLSKLPSLSSLTAQEIVVAMKRTQCRLCISMEFSPVFMCKAFVLNFRKVFDRFNWAEWSLAE